VILRPSFEYLTKQYNLFEKLLSATVLSTERYSPSGANVSLRTAIYTSLGIYSAKRGLKYS